MHPTVLTAFCSSPSRRSPRRVRSTSTRWPAYRQAASPPARVASSSPAAQGNSTRSRPGSSAAWSGPPSRCRRGGCRSTRVPAVRRPGQGLRQGRARAGADGLLLLPPYLVEMPQAGLIAYTREVAAVTDLPVIVYNRNNARYTESSAVEVAQMPNVVGFKDGTGDLDQVARIVRAVTDSLDGTGKPFLFFNGMPTAEATAAGLPRDRCAAVLVGDLRLRPRSRARVLRRAETGNDELVDALLRGVLPPAGRAARQRARLRGLAGQGRRDHGGPPPGRSGRRWSMPTAEDLAELQSDHRRPAAPCWPTRSPRPGSRRRRARFASPAPASPRSRSSIRRCSTPSACTSRSRCARSSRSTPTPGWSDSARPTPTRGTWPACGGRRRDHRAGGVRAQRDPRSDRRAGARRRHAPVGTAGHDHHGQRRGSGVLPVRGGLPGHRRATRGRPVVGSARRRGTRRRAVQRLPVLQVGGSSRR